MWWWTAEGTSPSRTSPGLRALLVPRGFPRKFSTTCRRLELLLSETEVTSGTLVFTGQTSQTATIPAGLLNNTNYRVVYDPSCPTILTTSNKTLTSFDANAGVSLGTVGSPVNVGWSVLVSTSANSFFSGSATFTVADAGTKTITFPIVVANTSYRVLLSPEGFFVPRVINKTTIGFTIELGHGLTGAETVVVGYDVFA
jgi:hypothetical protein